MLPIKPNLPKEHKQLLDLYKKLSATDRETVMALTAFLSDRGSSRTSAEPILEKPLNIPRPENESVVKAMKRLSEIYSMLDKAPILDKASNLMSAHILQGESAESVIDQLEILFSEEYKRVKTAV